MATPIEQLEAMRNLAPNWDGYNADPPVPEVIDLAKAFVRLLGVVRRDTARFPDLHVSPGRAGGVLIMWEDREYEHELGVEPDGSVEFLHESKRTKEMVTRKFTPAPQSAVDPGLLIELHALSAA